MKFCQALQAVIIATSLSSFTVNAMPIEGLQARGAAPILDTHSLEGSRKRLLELNLHVLTHQLTFSIFQGLSVVSLWPLGSLRVALGPLGPLRVPLGRLRVPLGPPLGPLALPISTLEGTVAGVAPKVDLRPWAG
jgi:hypothetical protein